MTTPKLTKAAVGAWLLVAVYYFYQYALRSSPSLTKTQIEEAFGAGSLATIAALFYYGYSPFSLVAGAALDRFGARSTIPIAAAVVGLGAIMFGAGNGTTAYIGRFLQGAGGAFALVGAGYLITKNFPLSVSASFLGATQMFGMAGGSAGQFLVGPMIKNGLPWNHFWIYAGVLGLVIAVCLFVLLPKTPPRPADAGPPPGWGSVVRSLGVVLRNPQSIICGFISGLLFIPTTILAMTWGVSFLQEARGREYDSAVMLAATVPLGWMIGCPLLGFITDRLGRRRPVILGGAALLLAVLAWVLYGDPTIFRGAPVGILMGIASGAAMIPYTVIKEVNSPELGGSATGIANFLNFTFSAVLSPVFGKRLAAAAEGSATMTLADYQAGFWPLLGGVGLAIVLACFLRETGPAVRKA